MSVSNAIEQLTIKDFETIASQEQLLLARCCSLALDFAGLVQINTVYRENVMLDYLITRYRDTEHLVHRLEKDLDQDKSDALLAIDAFIESVSSENASLKLNKYQSMIQAITKLFPVTNAS